MALARPAYVYGVVRSQPPKTATTGVGGAAPYAVEASGIAALVSDVPPARELVLGREEMTTHEQVLEEAMRHGPVLPMRFGVVMESADAVRGELLEAHHDDLERQLRELDGHAELRLRAVYDESALMRRVVEENPNIARTRQALRGVPEAAAHFKKIALGEAIAGAVERVRDADTEDIVGSLQELAVATELAAPAHERIAFQASFLVSLDTLERFDAAVDEAGRRYAGLIRFRYTGPLPPHSFVNLAAGV